MTVTPDRQIAVPPGRRLRHRGPRPPGAAPANQRGHTPAPALRL